MYDADDTWALRTYQQPETMVHPVKVRQCVGLPISPKRIPPIGDLNNTPLTQRSLTTNLFE